MKKTFLWMFEVGILQILLLAALLVACCVAGGCSLERADPAARSNRATYTISVVAHEGSNVNAYVADGLMATADGEGAITQPSTLTTEQSPDITVPGDAVSAGIQAVGHVAGKAIDAHAAAKAGNGGTGNGDQGTVADPHAADCPNGNCQE